MAPGRTRGLARSWRAVAIAAALLVAFLFVFAADASAQSAPSGTSSWANGHGNCGDIGNGSGFVEQFKIGADVAVVGRDVSILFRGVTSHLWNSPVKGTVADDGSFVLRGAGEGNGFNGTPTPEAYT